MLYTKPPKPMRMISAATIRMVQLGFDIQTILDELLRATSRKSIQSFSRPEEGNRSPMRFSSCSMVSSTLSELSSVSFINPTKIHISFCLCQTLFLRSYIHPIRNPQSVMLVTCCILANCNRTSTFLPCYPTFCQLARSLLQIKKSRV